MGDIGRYRGDIGSALGDREIQGRYMGDIGEMVASAISRLSPMNIEAPSSTALLGASPSADESIARPPTRALPS